LSIHDRYKGVKDLIDSLLLGILAYYSLYYIQYGLVYTVLEIDRITYFVLNKMPLTTYEIDLIIIMATISLLLIKFNIEIYKLLAILSTIILGFYMISIGVPGNIIISITIITTLVSILRKRIKISSLVKGFLIILLVTQLMNFIASAINPYLSTDFLPIIQYRLRSVETIIEYIIIILFIIYTWIQLLVTINKIIYPGKTILSWNISNYIKIFSEETRNQNLTLFHGLKGLVISICIVIFILIYLHSSLHNPNFNPISVDTYFYWKFILLVKNKGLFNALCTYNLARPLYLVFIYYLYLLLPIKDPVFLLDLFLPAIYLSLLIIAVYLVTSMYFDKNMAGLTSFLTAIGHSTITFIAGGFQANSLALGLAILWFYVYPRKPILLLPLSIITVLIHPWTFFMYSATIIVYYTFIRKQGKKKLFQLYTILAASLLIGEITNWFLRSMSPTIAGTETISKGIYHVNSPLNWIRVFELWTWGSHANYPIIALTIINPYYTFISTMLSIIAPFTIIGNEVLLHRLLLNTPIEILAAKVLSKINKQITIILILLTLIKTLYILTALTPLNQEPWTNIIQAYYS